MIYRDYNLVAIRQSKNEVYFIDIYSLISEFR